MSTSLSLFTQLPAPENAPRLPTSPDTSHHLLPYPFQPNPRSTTSSLFPATHRDSLKMPNLVPPLTTTLEVKEWNNNKRRTNEIPVFPRVGRGSFLIHEEHKSFCTEITGWRVRRAAPLRAEILLFVNDNGVQSVMKRVACGWYGGCIMFGSSIWLKFCFGPCVHDTSLH